MAKHVVMNIQRALFFFGCWDCCNFCNRRYRQSSAGIRRIRGRWLTRKLWSMASLWVKGWDDMDTDSCWLDVQYSRKASILGALALAYQSFGVVYGDLSVSPLYVFRSTFAGNLRTHVTEDEIYGVLSFIIWTLTLIPVIKYALIVLSADDNGEG